MSVPRSPAKPWRRPIGAVNDERVPRVYRLLGRVARLLIPLVARRHWVGQEHVPRHGGALVVANHISNCDAVLLGEYLVYSGRWPRYLGKSGIFETPVLGWVLRRCEQIPVHRDTPHAGDALVHARAALDDGRLVVIYPEGTITADPDGWPMTPRTGAARLALATGVPVIPIGQTGADAILGGRDVELRRLFARRRRDVRIKAGPPVDLGPFRLAGEPDRERLDAASAAIMDAVVAIVAELRGEAAPEGRWDMRLGGRVTARRG